MTFKEFHAKRKPGGTLPNKEQLTYGRDRLHHIWGRGAPDKGLLVMQCQRPGCSGRWRSDERKPPTTECDTP